MVSALPSLLYHMLWEKVSCHFVRILKQVCGEVSVMRNGGFFPIARKPLSPLPSII
jgi:hypothetical protein